MLLPADCLLLFHSLTVDFKILPFFMRWEDCLANLLHSVFHLASKNFEGFVQFESFELLYLSFFTQCDIPI